jgi:type IV pilus assembly protein PilB
MGIAAFNVAASVGLITAQRLVRRLCDVCKLPVSEEVKAALLSVLTVSDRHALRIQLQAPIGNIYRAIGCQACDKGYKGRVGLFQIMPITEAMQALILREANVQALAAQAILEGVLTLRQSGWVKVLRGITSVEEVMAYTPHG